MSSFYLVLGLVFSLLIAIVALANTETVTVRYIFGQVEVPLILLIFGSAAVGALAMGLFSLFRSIRNALASREAKHHLKELEKKIKNLEQEKLFLEAELNKALSVAENEDDFPEISEITEEMERETQDEEEDEGTS